MSHFLVDAVMAEYRKAITEDQHAPAEVQAARYVVATIRGLTKDYPGDFRMPTSVLTALADEINTEFSGRIPCDDHADAPAGSWGDREFLEWAEEMEKTHVNEQCIGCGLWKIWTPKEPDRAV